MQGQDEPGLTSGAGESYLNREGDAADRLHDATEGHAAVSKK